MAEELPFCECGKCGLRVTKKGNRFILGHNMRGVPKSPEHSYAIHKALTGIQKPPRTPEHCYNLSKASKNSEAVKAANEAKKGVPLPPKRCAAIKKGLENSEAVKANADKQRGGNDLVIHHYIYDESDLSLNTVQMTRSDHTKLHNVLKGLGYKVPRINVKEVK